MQSDNNSEFSGDEFLEEDDYEVEEYNLTPLGFNLYQAIANRDIDDINLIVAEDIANPQQLNDDDNECLMEVMRELFDGCLEEGVAALRMMGALMEIDNNPNVNINFFIGDLLISTEIDMQEIIDEIDDMAPDNFLTILRDFLLDEINAQQSESEGSEGLEVEGLEVENLNTETASDYSGELSGSDLLFPDGDYSDGDAGNVDAGIFNSEAAASAVNLHEGMSEEIDLLPRTVPLLPQAPSGAGASAAASDHAPAPAPALASASESVVVPGANPENPLLNLESQIRLA